MEPEVKYVSLGGTTHLFLYVPKDVKEIKVVRGGTDEIYTLTLPVTI